MTKPQEQPNLPPTQPGPTEEDLEPARVAGLAWIDRIRKLIALIKLVMDVLPQAQSQAGATGQGDAAALADLQQQLTETQTRAERVLQQAEKGGAGQSQR